MECLTRWLSLIKVFRDVAMERVLFVNSVSDEQQQCRKQEEGYDLVVGASKLCSESFTGPIVKL